MSEILNSKDLNPSESIENGKLIETIENIDNLVDQVDRTRELSQSESAIKESECTENMDINSDIYASEKLQVTESEDEEVEQANMENKKKMFPLRKKNKKIGRLIDSDSDDEEPISKTIDLNEKEPSEKESLSFDNDVVELSNKKNCLIDSESEEENCRSPAQISEAKILKISTLIDSDSDDDTINSTSATKSNPPKRASAKQSYKEMMAIKSETQRLIRENNISIPYHIPKHHTLKEFMKRRTITQPQNLKNGMIMKTPRLKMNQEELEQYAIHLEERAKEASNFFRSESETEDEENIEEPVERFQKSDTIINTIDTENPSLLSGVTEHNTQTTGKQSLQIGKFRGLIEYSQLAQSPTIKGDPKMLIDFETGNIISPKPNPVDNLKERFLKNSIKKKSKTINSIQILSTENGQVEITKMNITTEEKANDVTKHKPGAAFLKLKENLRALIAKKRREEMVKKLENEKEKEDEMMKCGYFDDNDEAEEAIEQEEKLWKQKNFEISDEEENGVEPNEDTEFESCNHTDNKSFDNENEENDENEDEDVENEDEENSEDEDEAVNEENELYVSEKNRKAKIADNDSTSSEDDENDESNEESDSEKNKNKKPKSRIIRLFQDSDDDVDDICSSNKDSQSSNIISQIPLTQFHNKTDEDELIGLCSGKFKATQNTDSISQIQLTQLARQIDEDELIELRSDNFKISENNNKISQIPMTQLYNQADEDELLGLCSGKFTDIQNDNVISQIPMTQMPNQTDEDELIALCSGTFTSTEKKIPKADSFKQIVNLKGRNKILSSDEEDDEINKTNPPKSKKLKKKKVKKMISLSDDEDEIAVLSKQKQSENQGFYVEYDSEENEIDLQLTKEDCRKQANLFVENEAELSESEWGSADEDEKDMDQYEMELGDEDEFDKTKIRHELEQIHMRKMLDDDTRELKKIQDMLFEDEENNGIGRQRQFRWKNNENGFSLDDPSFENEPGTNLNDSKDEDMDEQMWRKMRHERELILKDNSKKLLNENATAVTESKISPPSKKINIITNKIKTFAIEKNNSTFLISKAVNKQSARGSFLVRDAEILSKLATMTKSTADSEETAGTVKIKPLKPKNFVFTTLTEQEHAAAQNFKRKTDETIGNTFKSTKKQKICETNCLIDQLL